MQSNARMNDLELGREVVLWLQLEGRHDAISVAAAGGVVTLTGTVRSWGERLAARKAAGAVHGVRGVVDDLEVEIPEPERRADVDLARAVDHALTSNPFVPESTLVSNVEAGVVTLRGSVEDRSQREEAGISVCGLPGVRGVRNLIALNSSEDTAREVGLAIEAALEDRAHSLARRVRFRVEDGCATLSGSVENAASRAVVLAAARGVPGVTHVEDYLRVGAEPT